MAKRTLVQYGVGTKVRYMEREWSVLCTDPVDDRCHQIIADNGRVLSVFTDLLEPIVDEELEEGSWDIQELAKQVRARR